MHSPDEESEGGQDEDSSIKGQEASKQATWATFASYMSLGIIYVDIGTSPLYTYATTLASSNSSSPLPPAKEDVLGVASLIFWIMTLVVLVKYVLIVLRADDSGEGGTFALYSLLCRSIGLTPFGTEVHKADYKLSRYNSMHRRRRTGLDATVSCLTSHSLNRAVRRAFRRSATLQMLLLLTVVLATAMVVGDGILTPSISMLGAVAGLQVETDNIVTEEVVVGISVAVLVLLFLMQSYDTSLIGRTLAPTVFIWLSLNAGVGVYNLVVNGGEIFTSLNPWQIVHFFARNGQGGWLMLGGVVLCITGAEAMYADMGHFTRRSVSLGFIGFVYPALMLTYWGQGAHLLNCPWDADKVFWKALPRPMFWPMFVSAVLASTVASQALITGAFSIMRQATMLGLFPRLTVQHTGHGKKDRVYMPEVNWTLMLLTVAVTAGFRSTERLKEAYGVAVMTVMTITTCMLALVMLVAWDTHPLLVLLFLAVYLPLEGAFLSATLVKVSSGGWVALAVAVILSTIKLTWWWGTSKKHNYVSLHQGKLDSLLKEDAKPLDPSNIQQQQQQPLSVMGTAGTNGHCTSFSSFHMHRNTADGQPAKQAFLLANPLAVRPLAGVRLQQRAVRLLQSGEAVARMPGLGVYYSESSAGVPAVMKHVLGNMPALYSSMVILTVRFVAVPAVADEERFLAWRDKSISGCFHAVVRYGYMDRVQHSQAFMEALVQVLLQQVLERKGVGSLGAASRLLTALTAKAEALACAAAAQTAATAGDLDAGLGGPGACAGTGNANVKGLIRSQLAGASSDGTCNGSNRRGTSAGGARACKACSGVASVAHAIAAADAAAKAAQLIGSVPEGAADDGKALTAHSTTDNVAALLSDFTTAELLEVLICPSAQQKFEQKQQAKQQQQQQQEEQQLQQQQTTWSIKARASLGQQQQQQQQQQLHMQQQQQLDMQQQECVEEQMAASAAGGVEGDGEAVLACIQLSSSSGPGGCASKQAAATAVTFTAIEDASAAGACSAATTSSAAVQSSSEVAGTSSASSAVPLRKSSSFFSGLRQRVSFRLARQAGGEVHRSNSSSSQAITQQAQGSSEAGRAATAAQGSAADALERPSYWDQLCKGHAADSGGENDSADDESAESESADMPAVMSEDEEHFDKVGGKVAASSSGWDGPDSKQLLPQQHTEEASAAVAAATGQALTGRNSIREPGSCRASGVALEAAGEGGLAGASGGELVLSQVQLAALHEAAQLLQAYQRRWVHCVGRTTLKVLPGGSIHRTLLGGLYSLLAANSPHVTAAWSIPTSNLIELGVEAEV